MSVIETYVNWMEEIAADNSHGYSQVNRNGPDYDCSSLVGTALNRAGMNVSKSSTTRNLRSQLLAAGFKTVSTTGARKRGDIYLKEGKHVVCCVDGSRIVHARHDEDGGIRGKKSGDQNGNEIAVTNFYVISGGWDYAFRYAGIDNTQTVEEGEGGKVKVTANLPVLKYGMTGEAVKAWQTILCAAGYTVDKDGSFGPDCQEKTKTFEMAKGITDTPEQVGPAAWKAGLEILDAVKSFS